MPTEVFDEVRPMRFAALLLLSACAGPSRPAPWTRAEVQDWYARWVQPRDGSGLGIGYRGSDAQFHYFMARSMDDWVFIRLPRSELRLAEEHPLSHASIGAESIYYWLDPAHGFARLPLPGSPAPPAKLVGTYHAAPLCSNGCDTDLSLRADGHYSLVTTFPGSVGPVMPAGQRFATTEAGAWSLQQGRVVLQPPSGSPMVLQPQPDAGSLVLQEIGRGGLRFVSSLSASSERDAHSRRLQALDQTAATIVVDPSDGISEAEAYKIAYDYFFGRGFTPCGGVDLPIDEGAVWRVPLLEGILGGRSRDVVIDKRSGTYRVEISARKSPAAADPTGSGR